LRTTQKRKNNKTKSMFSVKTKIIFGNAEENIKNLNLKGDGLLCTRRNFEFKNKDLNKDLYHLKISPEPNVDDIYTYFDKIKDINFDYIIAIGGGSVLDVAKILSVMDKETNVEDLIGVDKVKKRTKKFIAIPTTHGSGSEVTKYAVLKFKNLKQTVVSENIVPDYAIIDENLAMNLPNDLSFYTSIDAFCHNIEAYFSRDSNPLTDITCENGMKFFFDGIDDVMENKIYGRKKMLIASVLGGISITNLRTNLIHALSHVIGGRYEISHGLANALFLQAYIRFYKNDGKFKNLCKILNKDVKEEIDKIYEKYNKKRLSDFIDKSEIDDIAKTTYQNKRLLESMKKEISIDEIKKIIEESFY